MPHRRSHFHFLNMIAPPECLSDEDKQDLPLTKKERKERKMVEKTIEKQIDIAALDRKELLQKKLNETESKKDIISQLSKN